MTPRNDWRKIVCVAPMWCIFCLYCILRYDEIVAAHTMESTHRKFLLSRLIHFSDAMMIRPIKPIIRLTIFVFVIFSWRKMAANMIMRIAFDRWAITAFPTVVMIKPRLRRYILSAFAPEIVRISEALNRIFFVSFLYVNKIIQPVMRVGTSSRKKVCWLVGRSSVFTKIPLSHQMIHAQRIDRIGIVFLFFMLFPRK